MTRISYSEDEDFPGQFALWRGNLARSLAGKQGRRALEDLHAALLALPNKRLIPNALVSGEDVCTVGALIVGREATREDLPHEDVIIALDATYSSCNPCGHGLKDHYETGCSGCDQRVEEQSKPDYRYGKWATPCKGYDWAVGTDEEDFDDGGWESDAIGESFGIPKMVAWRLVELNDYQFEGLSPEDRYKSVLAWVEKRLAQTPEQVVQQEGYYS